MARKTSTYPRNGALFFDMIESVQGSILVTLHPTAVMRATFRFILSLLVCVAFLAQTGPVWSAPPACPAHATAGSMAAMTDCQQSDTNQHAPAGKLCKAAAACSPTVPAFRAVSGVSDSPYQRFEYPHVAAHFILQDFPQTLLRPPRLA